MSPTSFFAPMIGLTLTVAMASTATAQNYKTVVSLADFDAIPSSNQAVELSNGPKISRIQIIGGQPSVQTVTHPEIPKGQKLVVIELPKNAKGLYDVDRLQVSVVFKVRRLSDTCSRTILQGEAKELEVPGAPLLKYFEVTYDKNRTATTLTGCLNPGHLPRYAEINTELRALRPFRDTLVFYVPQDVTVEAEVWEPTMRLRGVAFE